MKERDAEMLKTYSSYNGTLYEKDKIKVYEFNPTTGHWHVTDPMGRIYYITADYFKFLN